MSTAASAAVAIPTQQPAQPPAQQLGAVTLPSGWDEYLLWLSFAVPGMLAKGNVNGIAHAIRHMPPGGAMLEIGSFCGLSTCVLSHLRRTHGVATPFFTCDRWAFEGQQLGALVGSSPTVTHDAYRTFVKESYLRNTRMFCQGDLPATIELDSDGFFDLWRRGTASSDVFGRPAALGGPLSFVYIDGNHTFEFADRDFRNSDEFLLPGGFLLFDDSADGSQWEVCRVVKDVLASGRYELVAKLPNYLVRKK
jgi:hypothetical protein